MAELGHLMRMAVLEVTLVLAAAGCGSATSPGPVPGSTAPSPIAVYALAEPVYGMPVAIDWDAASHSFFVGTENDGTIYRGHLDDPEVPVYIPGRPGQTAAGVRIACGRLYVAGGIYGDIRVYDLISKTLVGRYDTGSGGILIDLVATSAGDVWATDGVRPVLWHLSPEQIAAGSGTPTAVPLAPQIRFAPGPYNIGGIALVTDRRLLVDKNDDGTLYRIDLDPTAPNRRAITSIAGATGRLGERMLLDGHRLVVADRHGLSIVELNDDASHAAPVSQFRDASFHETTAVAHAEDRYLVVNGSTQPGQPYTITSVPASADESSSALQPGQRRRC